MRGIIQLVLRLLLSIPVVLAFPILWLVTPLFVLTGYAAEGKVDREFAHMIAVEMPSDALRYVWGRK